INPKPRDEDENVQRHRARNEFAAQFVPRGGVVLDCASGSGDGRAILAAKAGRVIGVDKSREAVDYALSNHASPKIEYNCRPLETLGYEVGSLDSVVSLETLEHIPIEACLRFLMAAGCWIKPGGVLVASSPMLRYRDGKPYVTSPYHVNEMPRDELLPMFRDALPGYQIYCYHQRQDTFLPLLDEAEGFMVVVARRKV
ncbi:MAG: class I SAM-dependent methyltransferase, partial [Gammaproteobacteria bacterium]|nr:class I SAM-dependent methyltransferase [Gammaproteobacteria bacterium]